MGRGQTGEQPGRTEQISETRDQSAEPTERSEPGSRGRWWRIGRGQEREAGGERTEQGTGQSRSQKPETRMQNCGDEVGLDAGTVAALGTWEETDRADIRDQRPEGGVVEMQDAECREQMAK
jgi:hypothetical protein